MPLGIKIIVFIKDPPMLRPFERRKEKNLNQFKIINIFIKFSVLGYLKKIELKDISRKYKVC